MILAHEQGERASADYDMELNFSQKVAEQRVEESGRFLERPRSFLQTEGLDWVSPTRSYLSLFKPDSGANYSFP